MIVSVLGVCDRKQIQETYYENDENCAENFSQNLQNSLVVESLHEVLDSVVVVI